jgi:hypothetical protein
MEHLKVEEEITPVFEKNFYFPLTSVISKVSDFIRRKIHCGSTHAYLLYIAVALIATLIYVSVRL